MFAEHGASAVSAEQIVARAGVSRGALYHHFHDKNDLLRAVFEQMEEELCVELAAELDAAASPAEGLARSVGWFLDVCARPEVHQIALVDAPAVLGWAAWREIETRYALGLLTDRLRALAGAGFLAGDPEVLARILLSAAMEGALMIASSDHPAETRASVEQTLGGMMGGLLG